MDFAALVLLPARRRDILLAKNLSMASSGVLGFGIFVVREVEVGFGISVFALIPAGLLQMCMLLLGSSART